MLHLGLCEQAERRWYVAYTAAALTERDTAMKKAQNECEGDARRLVDIIRASVVVDTESAFEAVVNYLHEAHVAIERDGIRVVRFVNRCKIPPANGQCDCLYHISIAVNDSQLRFVCELQIQLKQLLQFTEAMHAPYAFFQSYLESGDAVSERLDVLEMFARRDVDDISILLTSALHAENEEQLEALDELFYKLNELEIVVLIRRRLLQLAAASSTHSSWFFFYWNYNWRKFARSLARLANVLKAQVL